MASGSPGLQHLLCPFKELWHFYALVCRKKTTGCGRHFSKTWKREPSTTWRERESHKSYWKVLFLPTPLASFFRTQLSMTVTNSLWANLSRKKLLSACTLNRATKNKKSKKPTAHIYLENCSMIKNTRNQQLTPPTLFDLVFLEKPLTCLSTEQKPQEANNSLFNSTQLSMTD